MFLTRWTRSLGRKSTRRNRKNTRHAKAARFRPRLEALEDRTLPAIFTVTTTADLVAVDDDLSLREAINAANADAVNDTIAFKIAGVGPHTIQVGSTGLGPLPTISQPVTIDGTTEPDYVAGGTPVIELDGSAAGALASGLTITGGNSIVRGLAINRFGEAGILLSSGAGNRIEGNHLGTNPAGTVALANGSGIIVFSAGNAIGGAVPGGQGNLIAGNTANNVFFGNGGNNNTVVANRIGTDVNGAVALGGNFGVTFVNGATGNVVGGTTAAKRNVISGNSRGVGIGDATGNTVQGNYIGLDSSGSIGVGNTVNGIVIGPAGASGNTIADNVISASPFAGVLLTGAGAAGNTVQRNKIGTDAAGKKALPNGFGVWIESGAANNLIGGTAAADGNLIAFNINDGVRVVSDGSDANSILGNSIHANGALGINLAAPSDFFPGVTPNDAGDADTGPNDLQNFPVLSLVLAGADTLVVGTLNSLANTQFRVEAFANTAADPSGFGEGKRFLGAFEVMTNGAGNASFGQLLPGASAAGEFVTATATHLKSRNTSEFSAAVPALSSGAAVVAGTLVILGDESANNVGIVQHSAGVTVLCDGITQTFVGIDQIRVATRGGADTVEVQYPPNPVFPPNPIRPAALDVDLGDGNDTFRLRATADLSYPPDPVAPTPMTVRGGTGSDRIAVEIGAPDGRRVAVQGRAEFQVDGGDDPDTINLALTNVDLLAESLLRADIGGGAGADILNNHMDGVAFIGKLDVAMSGFAGDDRIIVHLDTSHFSGSTDDGSSPDFTLAGHTGNDLLEVTTDYPAGNVECDGGDGNDTVSVHANVDWNKLVGPNPPFPPPVVHFAVAMRGGAGLDRITSRMGVEPTPFLTPLIRCNLTMDGGAGNDVLDAIFSADAKQKVAELNVVLLGGDGDDMFRLLWTPGAFEALAFADGGAGFDTGLFSPGTKYVNVESVG